ncbi:MAG: hypothetical protein AAF799_46065 [Myxococcota bacterium]
MRAVSIAAGTLLAANLGCGEEFEAPPNHGDTSTGEATTDASSGTATPQDSSGEEGSSGQSQAGWSLSLEAGTEVGAFFSVWGPDPSLLYAVAGQPLDGGLSLGALYERRDETWSPLPLPKDTPTLNWVFGIEDRRFIVGDFGVILVRDGDEGEWTQYGCETILPLWGVWGTAIDDVWTVGGDGFNRDPVACHFDGETWTPYELPELSIESHALFKVWGTASDDVWAVGHEGLLMHWTGEAEGWTEVPSGTEFDLISLWGTGPDEILAVGGRSTAVLSRYDGTAWTSQEIGEMQGLNGIWMAPDGEATVVGPWGGAAIVPPGAMTVEVEDAATPLALHGVFGFDDERWGVGGSLDMAPPYVGVAVVRTP